MYKNITKTSIKVTTAKSARFHTLRALFITTISEYNKYKNIYNKTIECCPGTVYVHVAHDVYDVGPP
jgi:hypothetical protein